MKSNLKFILKKMAAVALSVSMVIPCVSAFTVDAYAAEATLIKEYDFEKGFREFYDTDSEFKIVSASGQMIKKTPEQREASDRVDANGFVIQGEGANTKYYKQSPGNQPSTKYDNEKGTVFFLAGTYDVPELVKEVSGVVEKDEEAAFYLDMEAPVGSVVREAATFKSAITFTNPFAKLEAEKATLAFWGKVPADSTEEKIAFIEFSNGTAAVSFCFDSSISRGEWHYYEYVIDNNAVVAYVDGVASEIAPVIDGPAPADLAYFLKNATIYFGATNTSSVRTVEETVFDDVAFYNGTMSAEESKALYDTKFELMNKKADIANPLAFIAFDSSEAYENINPENPSNIEDFNINGHAVPGVAVVENTKGDYKNGIKVDNPFSGKELEGLTVGYWVQVEPKERVVDKGTSNSTDPSKYTGNYPGELVINETVQLAFIDKTKVILNPKHNESAEGFSYLFTKNRMQAHFEEGGYYGMNTGNLFEIDMPDDAALNYVDESRNWHYVTNVITNNGVTIYLDGVKVTGYYENRAPRFFDGYYRRISEREKISTLYGAFGGSGNQTCTQMMTFLTYADTDMYFGWLPTSDYRNETTSPMNITRMSCYDNKMTDEQVAILYETELAAINEYPEYVEVPDYTPGDVNEDEQVNAVDALFVLKVAAKIEEATERQLLIGDMDGGGTLDAKDALAILKIAAKID